MTDPDSDDEIDEEFEEDEFDEDNYDRQGIPQNTLLLHAKNVPIPNGVNEILRFRPHYFTKREYTVFQNGRMIRIKNFHQSCKENVFIITVLVRWKIAATNIQPNGDVRKVIIKEFNPVTGGESIIGEDTSKSLDGSAEVQKRHLVKTVTATFTVRQETYVHVDVQQNTGSPLQISYARLEIVKLNAQ